MSSEVVSRELRLRLDEVELRRVRLPPVTPFRTSFGTQVERDVLLLRAVTSEGEGWGECVALRDPLYSSEYVDGAQEVLRRYYCRIKMKVEPGWDVEPVGAIRRAFGPGVPLQVGAQEAELVQLPRAHLVRELAPA